MRASLSGLARAELPRLQGLPGESLARHLLGSGPRSKSSEGAISTGKSSQLSTGQPRNLPAPLRHLPGKPKSASRAITGAYSTYPETFTGPYKYKNLIASSTFPGKFRSDKRSRCWHCVVEVMHG